MPKKRNGKKPKIGSGGGVATAMAISEADVLELRVEATRRAARAAGMNTELMTFEEIREALPGYNGEVGRALERFLTAYQAWFDFHASVSDRPGQLRDAEKTELVRLIREKEEARTDFVALVELPASQELARAWVLEALDPMLVRLSVEIPRLEHRRWSWRFHVQTLEVIVPLSGYAAPIFRTRGLFTRELRGSVQEHDRWLEELVRRLVEAQAALVEKPGFRAAVTAGLAAHRAVHPEDRPWGAFPEDRLVALAAEFVLNGLDVAPPGSTTMERFWNDQRARILASVPGDVLAPVSGAGERLRTVAQKLRTASEGLRQRLVEMFAIVAGPPVSAWAPESF